MKRGIVVGVATAAVVVAGLAGSSSGTSHASPSTASSPSAGAVKVTIDGQDQNVQGTLVCAQRPDGKRVIAIDRVFSVVITPGTPPTVHSVVFPYGGIAGLGMEFDEEGPGPGQASVVEDGGSYRITGAAADAANLYKTTRPFEIDATCPSNARTPSTGGSPQMSTTVTKPAVSKPAVLPPPKGLDAPSQAVTAAKNAPATRVDPAKPPKPLKQGDFHQLIKSVVDTHRGNVQVVTVNNQALVRPRHWDYLDYDTSQRPALYNPLTEAVTFRYFYAGAYRELSVPAGGRVVLDVASAGVFPFTAVSDSYVASGSFTGGAPPPVYHNVSAYVPADNQAVQVGQVTVVGHDDSQPADSQDVFMLDDSTLAWGQVTDAKDGGQVAVTKTQTLPGIGPTDDGGVLVALAAPQQPAGNWWPWALGGAALVIAAGLIAWMVVRRNRARI